MRLRRRSTLTIFIPSNRTAANGKPAPMDGLNEIIADNRTSLFVGSRVEKENVEWCAWHIRAAMNKAKYRPMTLDDRQVCDVHICVHEVSRRRDVSNVYGGVFKYALDALTGRHKYGAGAIWDDNSKWLRYISPSIVIDPANPGIEITVIPLEVKHET